jgi:hypothetical protein
MLGHFCAIPVVAAILAAAASPAAAQRAGDVISDARGSSRSGVRG